VTLQEPSNKYHIRKFRKRSKWPCIFKIYFLRYSMIVIVSMKMNTYYFIPQFTSSRSACSLIRRLRPVWMSTRPSGGAKPPAIVHPMCSRLPNYPATTTATAEWCSLCQSPITRFVLGSRVRTPAPATPVDLWWSRWITMVLYATCSWASWALVKINVEVRVSTLLFRTTLNGSDRLFRDMVINH